jgi:hypothetical protein
MFKRKGAKTQRAQSLYMKASIESNKCFVILPSDVAMDVNKNKLINFFFAILAPLRLCVEKNLSGYCYED